MTIKPRSNLVFVLAAEPSEVRYPSTGHRSSGESRVIHRVQEDDAPDQTSRRPHILLILLDMDAPSGSVRGNVSVMGKDS